MKWPWNKTDGGGARRKHATLATLTAFGMAGLFLVTRCDAEVKKPNTPDARRILAYGFPRLDVFGPGGVETKLSDEQARLDRHDCWQVRGGSMNERRYPKPKYDCVFWFTASDGRKYIVAMGVEYFPKSTITEVNGRRIDFANVGRYAVSTYPHRIQRTILRRQGIASPD